MESQTANPDLLDIANNYFMYFRGQQDGHDRIGLATIEKEKFEGNPIFSRGEEGEWDEGAIWFTTVEKINGIYYLWYEGYGGGTARRAPYGSYLKGGKSQVGLATMEADYFFVVPG